MLRRIGLMLFVALVAVLLLPTAGFVHIVRSTVDGRVGTRSSPAPTAVQLVVDASDPDLQAVFAEAVATELERSHIHRGGNGPTVRVTTAHWQIVWTPVWAKADVQVSVALDDEPTHISRTHTSQGLVGRVAFSNEVVAATAKAVVKSLGSTRRDATNTQGSQPH